MNPFDIPPRSLPRSVDTQAPRDASATPDTVDANGASSEAGSFGSLLDGLAEQSSGNGDRNQPTDGLDLPSPAADIKMPDAISPDISNSLYVWLEGLLPKAASQTAAGVSVGNASPDDALSSLMPQNLPQSQDVGDVSVSPLTPKVAVSVQHQETHFKPIVENSATEVFSMDEGPAENASGGLSVKLAEMPPKTIPLDRQNMTRGPLPQSLSAQTAERQDSSEQQAPTKDRIAAMTVEGAEVKKPPAPNTAQNGSASLPPATLLRIAEVVSAEIRSVSDGAPANGSPSNKALRTVSIKASDNVLRILNLQLHPAELGTVTIKMRLAGDQLQMELHTEKEETARLLRHDSEKLSMLLRGSGYRPDTITIQVGDAAVQDRASTQRQQTDMQFQGQSFQQGGAGQEGHPRNRENQYVSTKAEPARDAGGDHTLGHRDSGGVYL